MNKLIGISQNIGNELCCGCSACVNVCPKQCLAMMADGEGFLYPILTDSNSCIDCNLCDKVCFVLHPSDTKEPIECIGVKNRNEIVREQSSSGGLFTALAEFVINNGGVVFGARFDDSWQVVIDYVENMAGLGAFRGSKYVQARVENSYQIAKAFLDSGRNVLYSGTYCQIAGLHSFLRKDYSNLISVDVVCHSVPSPLVWERYLSEISSNNEIMSVNFRDKSTGWTNYGYNLCVSLKNGIRYNIPASAEYMKCLTMNISTRPACSNCMARYGRSCSDISIGDYWGLWDIQPEYDDNKGVSIVLIYTDKLKSLIGSMNLDVTKVSIMEACKYNSGLTKSTPKHSSRQKFFKEINEGVSVKNAMKNAINEVKRPSFFTRLLNKIMIEG